MRVLAALAVIVLTMSPAVAATTMPSMPSMPSMPAGHDAMMMMMMMMRSRSNIAVDATGEVQYTPDIARITVGINGEAASAAAATADVGGRANAVIGAFKSLGIPDADIKTSGFNLYYRQASEGPNGIVVKGAFVASESVNVKTPVDKAGAAIDAAIRAGANQSYGLEYDTSQHDSLYRQAVQRAVAQARELAVAAASAAGVKLGDVMSIAVPSSAAPAPVPLMRMAAPMAAAAPPISPGTGTISASVSVTYSIAR